MDEKGSVVSHLNLIQKNQASMGIKLKWSKYTHLPEKKGWFSYLEEERDAICHDVFVQDTVSYSNVFSKSVYDYWGLPHFGIGYQRFLNFSILSCLRFLKKLKKFFS